MSPFTDAKTGRSFEAVPVTHSACGGCALNVPCPRKDMSCRDIDNLRICRHTVGRACYSQGFQILEVFE